MKRFRELEIALNEYREAFIDTRFRVLSYILVQAGFMLSLGFIFLATLLVVMYHTIHLPLGWNILCYTLSVLVFLADMWLVIGNSREHEDKDTLSFAGFSRRERAALSEDEEWRAVRLIEREDYHYLISTWTRSFRPMQILRRAKFRLSVRSVVRRFGRDSGAQAAYLMVRGVPVSALVKDGPMKVNELIESGVPIGMVNAVSENDIDTSLFGSLTHPDAMYLHAS